MSAADVEHVEVELILEAIYRRYGYDFRQYSRQSVRRRLEQRRQAMGLPTLSHMLPALLRDTQVFELLLADLSISVTRMFRDPHTFLAIRHKVVPLLKTYPYVKIWHAGCSTGEEAYSMAILLHEEGFLERAHIYATDFNNRSLATGRSGIYGLEAIQRAARGYLAGGGGCQLAEYYRSHYGEALFHRFLRESITFSHHNLVTDGAFGDMNLILCRNVLIYFEHTLQEQVVALFRDSLCPRGFLCLGTGDTIELISAGNAFTPVDTAARLYRLQLPGDASEVLSREPAPPSRPPDTATRKSR